MTQFWMPRDWAVAVCLLALGLSTTFVVRASDTPPSQATTRILDGIEKVRSKLSQEDRRAAHRLNANGDRAYRKGNYSEADTYYENSYPNFPNARAYIMTGDSAWRAAVQFQESEVLKPENRPPACAWDNSYFARDLMLDVAQHQEVGLALAKRENDRRLLRSELYRRARESATCLHDVAKFYEAQPKTACVDIVKMRNCLGSPLFK